MAMDQDWRDGFFFLGNQLSLDFLNTLPDLGQAPHELLPDTVALLRWTVAAGITTSAQAKALQKDWTKRNATGLTRLHAFREEWRKIVLGIEAGKASPRAFITKLNGLLERYPMVDEVVRGEGFAVKPARHRRFEQRKPADFFAPLADAVATLLTAADYSRIRKCAKCGLHFYDTSKKGTRHWCSMRLCGNRYKVRAYYERKKSGDKPQSANS